MTDRLVSRRRLDDVFAMLLEEHKVLGVWATAGAGKTTAVRQGVLALDEPVAWLTLDSSDVAPGRFLNYLRAAVGRALPAGGEADPILGPQITHFEAAALLAQGLPRARAVIVIDELERIADATAALEVVSGFLRYLHPDIRVVLVGRREVEIAGLARLDFGAVGRLGEEQLAFDTEEAASALALRGLVEIDAKSVVEATGGWVTGVLFEAWKSREHVGGSGGEADPLAGYLGAEILDGLYPDEREFLIRTSMFDEVDSGRAEALGQTDAVRMLRRLRSQHLPIIWRRDGEVMRCHTRFRDYLRSLLDRRDPALTARIRYAYGLVLAEEGRHEEALEVLLREGRMVEALAPARLAVPAAVARLDLDLVQLWLDRFATVGLSSEPFLRRAQLGIAVARENFRDAVECADALSATGDLDDRESVGYEHRVLAAWAYWHVGRLDDTDGLLSDLPDGHWADVIRYMCSLVDNEPPLSIPQLAGGPLDALMLRVSFARGRLGEIRRAPVTHWTPAASERASAMRALGDLEATRTLLSQGPGALANLRFEGMVMAELMIDLQQELEAREALVKVRKRIHDSGSLVLEAVSRILAAKLELRLRHDSQTALAILRGLETGGAIRTYGYLAEQIDMWTGCALLFEDRNDEALARLRTAIGTMSHSGRTLEMATAAIYLAEAEARCDNEVAASAAAQLALTCAARQGSRFAVLQGLDDFPKVAAGQIELENDPDGPWHEIGHSIEIRSGARPLSASPLLHLRDLGQPALICDGEERRPRIAKCYALLAYLVEMNGHCSRAELLDALFDGRQDDSTSAYLRQAVQSLRGLLPDGIVLLREADSFLLQGAARIETDTMRLRAKLASAAALIGDARLAAAGERLDSYRGLVYLQGVTGAWVERRRAEIDDMLINARVNTAVAAIQASRFDVANILLSDVVSADPLREQAWRLLMRISAAQGFDDRAVDAYRRCEQALESVGLEPSVSTRLLIERLRR